MAELSIWIAGEAGQGLVTAGQILSRSAVRAGLELHVQQDYMSRIRGGLNSWRMRCADAPIQGPSETVDLLMALSRDAGLTFSPHLTPSGRLFADSSFGFSGDAYTAIPLGDFGGMKNVGTVAVAMGAAALGLSDETVSKAMALFFSGETLEMNRELYHRAILWAREALPSVGFLFPEKPAPTLAINGNEAIALGAMAAGCNFVSYYPMTPATSVVQNIITHGKDSVHVAQVEDEIAAINMALGASYAGGRAMVATSGGGLALMTEGISLAGITETPVVIVLAQRPGPATGLPTRTEQGDLDLVRFAGHGEFPRAILTPDTPSSCFELTHRAFDLAERFQSPVFIITDQYLADSIRNTPPFDLYRIRPVSAPQTTPENEEAYLRYALNVEGGVSPRVVPGFSKALVVADSDEHTEAGHITEDHGIRVAMQTKRMKKEEGLKREAILPVWEGGETPDLLLISWGSSSGACRGAAERLKAMGVTASTLHFVQVWPMDGVAVASQFGRAVQCVVVESNSTGQFARLLLEETGVKAHAQVLRFDGLPMSAEWIVDHLSKEGVI